MNAIISKSITASDACAMPEQRLSARPTWMLDALESHVAASFSAALSRLFRAGASIADAPLGLLADAAEINRFASVEAFASHRPLLTEYEAEYDACLVNRIRRGTAMSAADYIDLHRWRHEWITRMEQAIGAYDALIMPMVPMAAPPIADLEASEDVF